MFHTQRHTGAEQLVLYEHQCVGEEVTEIQRRHADVGLLRARTDAPNDLTRSSAVPQSRSMHAKREQRPIAPAVLQFFRRQPR
jgi:hypothetical protein